MELISKLRSLVWDEEGAGAIEYGLIAAFVAVIIGANVEQIGTDLNQAFKLVADKLPTV